jgi:chemotaxis protein histidine kinase CheA
VVQLHHGSVDFTSDDGKGTTFYLRFPLSENIGGAEPPRVAAERPVGQA